jgi:hypothetical protein
MYDAAYVALAEAMNTTLRTGDRELARAPGPQCSRSPITYAKSSLSWNPLTESHLGLRAPAAVGGH